VILCLSGAAKKYGLIGSDMLKRGGALLLCMASFAMPVPALAAVSWDASTGFDYSSGKYRGSSDTMVLDVPFALRMQTDSIRLEASIPYLRVRGPGTYAGGVVVGGGNAVTTRSGMGDITLGGAWALTKDGMSFPGVELQGNVKVPTASSELGTGKYDYTLQTNLNHSISASTMLFGTLGYQWLSDFRGIKLKDGVLANAGVNFRASDRTNLGLSVNYRQPYYQTLNNQLSLSPYLLWDFANNWRLSAYGLAGFTNASPNVGGGLRVIFFQR
jgi:Putative MetA-pathway of phenol degradation